MTDRDAAPAAAEGADDELYAEFLRGFMPEVAPTSLVGLTLRHAWDAALEVYGAARPAPPAAPREGGVVAELIARGEAMKEAFFTGDDNREAIACIEWDAAVEAAREAARGDGEATP